jgi:hypothetical protein
VNYAIRFSGPVTPSPPAAPGMASETPNLPARRSASYKDAFVPRRFSHDPPRPFPPSTFLHGAVVPEASTSSTFPAARVPTERYDAASETNASSQSPAFDSLDPSLFPRAHLPLIEPSDRGSALGGDVDDVSGSRSPATWSRAHRNLLQAS